MKLSAVMILGFFLLLSTPLVKADEPLPQDETVAVVVNDTVDPVLVVNQQLDHGDHDGGDLLTQ